MKPDIDWDTLTNDDISDVMEEGREEIERRIALLTGARDGRPKGERRPKNGARQAAADLDRDATST
jgi:uncharacterized small protein (DUF1192 family)